jgi:formate hydrogenlyase subunit 6/NADH:ubiquinone oxidoreductase subunit I
MTRMSRSNSEQAMSDTGVKDIPNSAGKKHRPILIAVVNSSCTGCEVCVDFCPVDCIDDASPAEHAGTGIPPIQIQVEECIGCQVCAKVCEELALNAIEMVSVDEFEGRFGIRFDQHVVGGEALLPAPAASA